MMLRHGAWRALRRDSDWHFGNIAPSQKKGLIGTIKPYISQLQNNGIYIRKNLIDAVLRDVGELT